MRQIIFLFILFSLCLIGCSKEKPVLSFAVGGTTSEIDYWEKLIKEFENKVHVKVEIIRQPTDTDQRRQSLIIPLKAGKKDPDIFLMDVAWIGQFAASNWLLPINSYIKRNQFNLKTLFTKVIRQSDIHNGKLIALPVYIDCGLLYFRKDLLNKYGCSVPKTWEDALKCAEIVQEGEKKSQPRFYGFVWQGAQYEGLVCNFIEFLASNKGSIADANGKITLNRERNIQALQFMSDLIHKYQISPPNTYTEMREEETRIFFESGNALFERNWPYAWKLHEREGSPVKGKVGITVLPKFKGGKHAAALGGWHIGISKHSDSKEEAWELEKFILSYETQKRLALDLGWNPGRRDIYNDPEVRKRLPHTKILKKSFEYSVARPNLPYYSKISEVLQRLVNAAISGRIKADEALQQAQKEVKQITNTYHE